MTSRPVALPLAVGAACALSATAPGQTTQAPESPPLFRAETELIQTDVTVLDRNGRFVDGLGKEEFELRIDGRVTPIRFFERVAAGSASEAAQLAAAGGAPAAVGAAGARGRTVLFYIDDLHQTLATMKATQALVGSFIDDDMTDDDQVGLASASGGIGFLQQLTNSRTVLRRALERVTLRTDSIRDPDRPPMTVYQALLVDKHDREVTAYFVAETIRNNPGITAPQAENLVRGRAQSQLAQAGRTTTATLAGLESLIRSTSRISGRKLVFMLSGGFVLDTARGNAPLRRITSAAARSGTVIYSMDMRGLATNVVDIGDAGGAELMRGLARLSPGEISAMQDGLTMLARESGGRAILNTNALEAGLTRALEETSAYYLLAWEPTREGQKPGVFRTMEVVLANRPELTARVRRGFYEIEPGTTAASPGAGESNPSAPGGTREPSDRSAGAGDPIPLTVAADYLMSTDRQTMVTAALHVPHASLSFAPVNGTQTARLRVSGAIFTDQGHAAATFDEVVTVAGGAAGERFTFARQVVLARGLYQVNAVVSDLGSGRTGNAQSWIEVPDLGSGRLALSSVIISTRPAGSGEVNLGGLHGERRFARNSNVRFVVFIYNAAKGRARSIPDAAIQIRLTSGTRTVLRTAPRRIEAEEDDTDRLVYGADLSLADLPPGRYVLQVTAIDRIAGASASQQARFEIE